MNDLNTLMHARVADEQPDVDRLLAVALREGHRIRRRRRVGYAGAGLAVAAIAATGVVLGAPGGGTAVPDTGSVASDPTSDAPPPSTPTLQVGQALDLGRRVTGKVVPCMAESTGASGLALACTPPDGSHAVGGSTLSGSGSGFAVVVLGPTGAVETYLSQATGELTQRYPGITIALPDDSEVDKPVYDGQAVVVHLAGWRQVGPVGDDKQSLDGPDGKVADIVWRDASGHDAWLADADKNDALTWTSPVHDGVFVTIQGGRGVTPAEVQALGASLTWK